LIINGKGVFYLSTYTNEYAQKLVSAEKAVQAVKSGDWVAYSHFCMFPVTLDRALAQRVGELTDVKVKVSTGMYKAQVAELDPEQKTFLYHSSFYSHPDRQLADKGLCFHLPGNYGQEVPSLFEGKAAAPNVAMIKTTPMDEHGFFNFGTSASFAAATIEMADIVIVEVNTSVPRCLGGNNENVHISKVDYIVESDNSPMIALSPVVATEVEQKMAAFIVEEIEDGCCLQLGIGGIPNMVGKILADSDVKDIGCHSEMLADAYVDLYEKGKITGARKNIDKYKMVYTFAMGSQKLYDFMDNNPNCAAYDVGYTNNIPTIAANDKVFSVNNALQVDLFGQACAESQGYRHISGSGGQLDFGIGANLSKGGKAYICINSSRVRDGQLISRIVPALNGVVTTPRSWNMNVVTEYGIAKIKGNPTWAIAENLIAIAHPQFQDELVQQAQKMGIWTKSNKIV
jgi:butyryl-CoA:acetate CoA-transferase